MLACHSLTAIGVGLSVAVASLNQGYSNPHALGVGIVGAGVGLLANAALALASHWRSPILTGVPDDPSLWQRMVRTAVEQSSQGTDPEVVRYLIDRLALVDLARGANGHRRPDWAIGSGPWPEELPADLRIRLLHVLSYDECGTDEVWEEMRLWLGYHGVGRPAHWQDRPSDVRPGE